MATKKVWKHFFIFVATATIFAICFSVLAFGADMISTIQVVAIFGGAVGVVGLCIGYNTFRLKKLIKVCTAHTEGEFLDVLQQKAVANIRVPVTYSFRYYANGMEYCEDCLDVEGVSPETPPGTKIPIWYDPNNPKVFFVAQDQSLRHDILIGRCILGVSIFLVLAGIIAFISI